MKYAQRAFYGLAALAGAAFVVALSAAPAPVVAQQRGNTFCLILTEIRTTEVTDARTIIYRMWNGDVWRNDLAYACHDLVHSGKSYSQKLHTGYLCSNSQLIVAQTGHVCRLGRFTQLN